MKRSRMLLVFLVMGVAMFFTVGAESEPDRKVVMRDDCDEDDPAWDATGGCDRNNGDVSNAEFFLELDSPLAAAVIGHQAWRNDPPYLKIEQGDSVHVMNKGGRVHTFTKVANFGGGRVPPLNEGLIIAPECVPGQPVTNLAPGEKGEVEGLTPGNHRFQCCIHPWMRALVKVEPPK